MSDYPANTAYAQRHIYTNPWLRKKTSLSQSQTLTVDADVNADADADAESESEEQPVSGTSASKGDKVGEELDFDDSPLLYHQNHSMNQDELDLSDHNARSNRFDKYHFSPPASLNPGHGQANNIQTSSSGGLQESYYSGNIQGSNPRASNMQGHFQPQTTAQGRYFSASPAEETDDFGDEYDPESLDIGAGGNGTSMREWSERD
ncbi:uncharacterized protein BDW70DRAFT_146775 [Aspergillus foveolatus]|uniref:uncharacterized protein n=1 Tax=Aspergillus foveolatus TaxID=210207 RepID=UPI003CCDC322